MPGLESLVTIDVWMYPVIYPGHFSGVGNVDVAMGATGAIDAAALSPFVK